MDILDDVGVSKLPAKVFLFFGFFFKVNYSFKLLTLLDAMNVFVLFQQRKYFQTTEPQHISEQHSPMIHY